jgi:hypothetical protein
MARMYKLRRTLRKWLIIAVIFCCWAVIVSKFSVWLIPIPIFIRVGFRVLKGLSRLGRRINSNGYVVLAEDNELEHRHVAKVVMGRDLYRNEIVHHINGKKTDNRTANLCLMDREKHELFHTWLRWKKEKSGRYPSFNDQKRILVNEYDGTLLENVKSAEKKNAV